jgi:triosephosphate isomerase
MRNKLIAANWKLNPSSRVEAVNLIEGIKQGLKKGDFSSRTEVAVCAPAIYLGLVQSVLSGTEIKLGAQNCYFEDKGAFTGELSPLALHEFGLQMVILGHSERRTIFGETDELVSKKTQAAIKHNLVPIVCVGESLEQREAGIADQIILGQIQKSLESVKTNGKNLVIAYEPVWAIGTGKTCSSEEAGRVCGVIRKELERLYSEAIAKQILILYGGSVKSSTIEEQMKQPEIDGALVGGASLVIDEFVQLVLKAG